jgi:hypothetical protein
MSKGKGVCSFLAEKFRKAVLRDIPLTFVEEISPHEVT